ncbi:MAG: ABC transporter ATP-binding protein, partial [Streptococcus sp.]|nr:ABC transporter ATP-binding protein [Streptococcus sp.]
MKLVWTYLKKYPKWLILDVLGAFTFVVVNLGLPTALARMIDQGITTGNKDKVYFWAIVMFIVIIAGAIGRVTLA